MNKLILQKGIRTKRVLQNIDLINNSSQTPTIRIVEKDPEWEAAYHNWLRGKRPTDNQAWQLGVFLQFEPLNEQELLVEVPDFKAPAFISRVILGGKLFIVFVFCVLFWLIVRAFDLKTR